jgi:hypothetical protein
MRELRGVLLRRDVDWTLAPQNGEEWLAEEALPRPYVLVLGRPSFKPLILTDAAGAQERRRLQVTTDRALEPLGVECEAHYEPVGHDQAAGPVTLRGLASEDLKELGADSIDCSRRKAGTRADGIEELLETIRSADWLEETELVEARVLAESRVKRIPTKHFAKPCVCDLLNRAWCANAIKSLLQDTQLGGRRLDYCRTSCDKRVIRITNLAN